jgi:ABC-type uncharacterized transport system involved in gliding motility auxiliary subunit
MASKKSSRWQLRLNQLIGLGLIFFIFLGVNYIGYKHFYRKNISLVNYTQLGGQTLKLLDSLPGPVRLIHFATPQGDPSAQLIMADVEAVLDEYRYKSKGKIELKKINPYIDFKEAKQYSEQYKVSDQENLIILDYNGQKKIIAYNELADIDNSMAMAGGAPTVKSFKAEQAITSAIQVLVQGKKAKVYFLSGHGEYDPMAPQDDKNGYFLLAEYIKRQNVEVARLNLVAQGGLPEDMDLLVIAGPNSPLSPIEIEILSRYLARTENPARLILMLDPKTQSGLEGLLKSYGVTFSNDLALTKVSILGQVRLFGEVLAEEFAVHPVTEWIGKGGVNLNFRACRSLVLTPSPQVTALVTTPEAYWGEVDLENKTPEFNADKDIKGPLIVAAAIDTGSVADGGVKLKGTRIVAVGGASFLINQMIDVAPLDFFLNSMNWALDKDTSMGISPKVPQEFNVSLGDKELQTSFLLLLAIPVAGGVIGFLVWMRRRK